ncbi:MAG: hypothetical protein USCAAHI_00532 [Beijerinckiaceae bacterium]|nr:MAG: hypothetical protein USCAAHI_00532 [Beijerinckiaceae bacterium]
MPFCTVVQSRCAYGRSGSRRTLRAGEQLVATSKRALPQELLDGADHLRLLGNDAAHIEAKTYQSIGEPEVRIAIDLTK